MVGGFLIILGVALGFMDYLNSAEIPPLILAWIQAHIHSPIVFLLALNLLLVFVGAISDIYSAILVVVPLIVPIANYYSIDPIHLGVIFLMNGSTTQTDLQNARNEGAAQQAMTNAASDAQVAASQATQAAQDAAHSTAQATETAAQAAADRTTQAARTASEASQDAAATEPTTPPQ